MSLNQSHSKDYAKELNNKFETQFTDINSILDKVIERNSKVVGLINSQGSETTAPLYSQPTTQANSYYISPDRASMHYSYQHPNFSTIDNQNSSSKKQENTFGESPYGKYGSPSIAVDTQYRSLDVQPLLLPELHKYPSFSPNPQNTINNSEFYYGQQRGGLNVNVREPNSGLMDKDNIQNLVRQSDLPNFQVTPVKHKTQVLKSSNEPLQYGSPSQDSEGYDYNGRYSSPKVDRSKKQISEIPKNKLEHHKGMLSSDTLLFDLGDGREPSTFQASKDNLDSTPDRKLSQNQELQISYLGQIAERLKNQDHDILEIFDESANTDIFGEKSFSKLALPKKKKIVVNKQLVEHNLEEFEKDMSYSNKYTPEKVLRDIEQTSDGKFFLVNSIKKDQNSTLKSMIQEEDPVEQIVVLTSARDVAPEEKLLSLYQQVSEVYIDGTSYIGEKYMGLRHGKGTYTFQDGYRYEGTWEEDQMSGFGILWVADEVKWYEGEWQNGTFHGRGIVYNITPEELDSEKAYNKDLTQIGNGWIKYEGIFEKGTKHGFGTLHLANGDTFTGNFRSDNIFGRGSYVRADNNEMTAGLWENNVLKTAY